VHYWRGPLGFVTKIQLVERKNSEQWYIFFPMAVARAMELEKGEEIEMVIKSINEIIVKRKKKKRV
jgi:antitoxin component of MazEF toxin-antitoxin module